MLHNLRGLTTIVFGFLVVTLLVVGCGGEAKRISSESPAAKDDRAINVVQKMRTQAVSPKVGRWAVVIGISDYKYDTRRDPIKGIPNLRFADRDARAFAQFLMSPEGGAFPSDHVLLLTDRKATIKEVRKALGDFLTRSLEDDLVIIFYAGHGIPDPQSPENLYLACYDTEPGNYYGTALPMWEIDVALNRTIRSKRVFVFADACHSAGIGGSRGKSVSKEFNEYMQRLAGSKEGVTKITASRADELSQERDNLGGGHGVFTYYLLQALSGKADENRDGFVTMTEAYDYLYDRVRSDTRHSQNPWASSYVSPDIPLGIVDSQVLAAIEVRSDAQKQRVAQPSTPYRPQPVMVDLPQDSNVAIKLARAKLAKDEPGVAREMVEGIIRRNDSVKPDALALKIEILIRDRDLRGAEDAEDLLLIPYPDHPSAKKSALLVYNYYLKETKGGSPADQIRQIEVYLKKHPAGMLEQKAREKLKELKASVKSGYDRTFKEKLILARGFINQNRFERARKEIEKAQDMAGEALSTYGISLDTSRISALSLKAATEEQQYRQEKAYQDAGTKAGRQPLEEKIKTWQEFVTANPGNPYVNDAEKKLNGLRQNAQVRLQARYNNLLGEAKRALNEKNFARSLEKLDAAADLFRKASESLSISLNQGDIYEVKERHRVETEKHREKVNRRLAKKTETQTIREKKGVLKKDFRQTTKGFNATTLYRQAVNLVKDGKYSNPTRAIDLLDKAIELDPGYIDAYTMRGIAYFNLNQYIKAIQDFDKAIELDPGDAGAYNNRGMSYAYLDQYIKAIQDFDTAIRLNQGYENAYNGRGVAYLNLNQHIKACADLKTACELGCCSGLEKAMKRGYCQ